MDIYGTEISSRLMLGTARYPSDEILSAAIRASGTQVVTAALRRLPVVGGDGGRGFLTMLGNLNVRILPNTAGCTTAREAVTTAKMAREVFETNWIKLEVIGDAETLQPDLFGLVEAAEELIADGFEVLPYTTEDLVTAQRLAAAGCRVIMPWGAPIGSGRGLNNAFGLSLLRARFPELTLIVDAGIGTPAHAAAALELGFDGVLINTAVGKAGDPVKMASAFARAVEAGRLGFEARPIPARDYATASTPERGRAVLA
jgi:thiazole synthase